MHTHTHAHVYTRTNLKYYVELSSAEHDTKSNNHQSPVAGSARAQAAGERRGERTSSHLAASSPSPRTAAVR